LFHCRKTTAIRSLMNKTYQASLWTQIADEARAVADRLRNNELRLRLLAVAERYQTLAKRAEAQSNGRNEESN
jgi:hypothetical protein